jgi:hypothetical protein
VVVEAGSVEAAEVPEVGKEPALAEERRAAVLGQALDEAGMDYTQLAVLVPLEERQEVVGCTEALPVVAVVVAAAAVVVVATVVVDSRHSHSWHRPMEAASFEPVEEGSIDH